MSTRQDEKIKKVVREGYARIAKQDSSCCAPTNSCCGSPDLAEDISKKIGYSEEELKAVPEGANLGLGCGNPVALASLEEGEIVLDLVRIDLHCISDISIIGLIPLWYPLIYG